MARPKTLERRLADLIHDYTLDAILDSLKLQVELRRPRRAKKAKVSRATTRKEQEGFPVKAAV